MSKKVNMETREELLGLHSLNPFIPTVSSARGYMLSNMFSQIITVKNGDEKIIQSGLEQQFGDNTFSKKLKHDSRILSVIKRYNGVDVNQVNYTTGLLVLFEDLVTNEIDYIEVPNYFSLHQYFGFEYVWNNDILNNLTKNTVLKADTVLADSPTVTTNKGYKYGFNANVALMTIPEVSEDPVIISERFSKKMEYDIFERIVVEFGTDDFPLNIYGDDDNYKAFPEIGERINEHSVVMALREKDTEMSGALFSRRDLQSFNPMFDKAFYVKKPGGIVHDIKVIHSPKHKKDSFLGSIEGVMKYANSLKQYYSDIVESFERIEREKQMQNRGTVLKVSPKLHRLLLDAYVMVNPDNKKVKYTHRNEPLDIYRIEFVIKHTIQPKVGAKITNLAGGKGIIAEVRETSKMPKDPLTGEYADIVMDPTSTPGYQV